MTMSEKNKLKKALETLKESGVRITPQRHAVLEYLLHSKSHPTADEIYKVLEEKFPNMSVATVYNNLRVLREVGLVRELTYGDESSRFDCNMTEHYHVICTLCDQVVDFHYPPLDEIESVAEQVTDFDISEHRLEFYGVCQECRVEERKH